MKIEEELRVLFLIFSLIILTIPSVHAQGVEACCSSISDYCLYDSSYIESGSLAEEDCQTQKIGSPPGVPPAIVYPSSGSRYCYYKPLYISGVPEMADCTKCAPGSYTADSSTSCGGCDTLGNDYMPIYDYRYQIDGEPCHWWESCDYDPNPGRGSLDGGIEGCICDSSKCIPSNAPSDPDLGSAVLAECGDPTDDPYKGKSNGVSSSSVNNLNNYPSSDDTCWYFYCDEDYKWDGTDCIPECSSEACASDVSEKCWCGSSISSSDTCSSGEFCCARESTCYADTEADVCRYDCECDPSCGSNTNLPCYCGDPEAGGGIECDSSLDYCCAATPQCYDTSSDCDKDLNCCDNHECEVQLTSCPSDVYFGDSFNIDYEFLGTASPYSYEVRSIYRDGSSLSDCRYGTDYQDCVWHSDTYSVTPPDSDPHSWQIRCFGSGFSNDNDCGEANDYVSCSPSIHKKCTTASGQACAGHDSASCQSSCDGSGETYESDGDYYCTNEESGVCCCTSCSASVTDTSCVYNGYPYFEYSVTMDCSWGGGDHAYAIIDEDGPDESVSDDSTGSPFSHSSSDVSSSGSKDLRCQVQDSSDENLCSDRSGVSCSNSAPSLSSISTSSAYQEGGLTYVKDGTTVTVTASSSDPENNYLKILCGTSSGASDLCTGDYESDDPSCTFSAPWTDSNRHTIYCRVDDGDKVSNEETEEIQSDNGDPSCTSVSISESPDSSYGYVNPNNRIYYNSDSTGSYEVSVSADDDVGVQKVNFPYATSSGDEYTSNPCSHEYNWDNSDTSSSTEYATVYDYVDHTSTSGCVFYVRHDNRDPTTSHTVEDLGGGDYKVTLDPDDGGSGVAQTLYCWDNSDTCTPSDAYLDPIERSCASTCYVRYHSRDNVNNQQSVQSTGCFGFCNCEENNPTVSVSPDTDTGNPGDTITYTVRVANNDNEACDASSFDLTFTPPEAGWSGVFATDPLTVDEASSAETTIDVTSPSDATGGPYTFTVTAEKEEDPTYSGSGTADYVVEELRTATVNAEVSTGETMSGVSIDYNIDGGNTQTGFTEFTIDVPLNSDLTLTASDGFTWNNWNNMQFCRWEKDGSSLTTNLQTTQTISEDAVYTALYQPIDVTSGPCSPCGNPGENTITVTVREDGDDDTDALIDSATVKMTQNSMGVDKSDTTSSSGVATFNVGNMDDAVISASKDDYSQTGDSSKPSSRLINVNGDNSYTLYLKYSPGCPAWDCSGLTVGDNTVDVGISQSEYGNDMECSITCTCPSGSSMEVDSTGDTEPINDYWDISGSRHSGTWTGTDATGGESGTISWHTDDSINGGNGYTGFDVTNIGCVQDCVRADPTVDVSPSSQSGNAGNTLDYTVTVTNNDNAACGSSDFDLDVSGLPGGWSSAFDIDPITNLDPGASDSSTLSVTSDAGAADGTYTFTVTAASATGSGSDTADYVVTTGVCGASPCTSTSDCENDANCENNCMKVNSGDSFECSANCAQEGEYAVDADSCCSGLTWNSGTTECEALPSACNTDDAPSGVNLQPDDTETSVWSPSAQHCYYEEVDNSGTCVEEDSSEYIPYACCSTDTWRGVIKY